MAIPPSQVKLFDDALVKQIEDSIDAALLRAWYDPRGGRTVDVTIDCEVIGVYKTEIIKRYIQAGWSEVVLVNSSENNERPGLCKVSLRRDVLSERNEQ